MQSSIAGLKESDVDSQEQFACPSVGYKSGKRKNSCRDYRESIPPRTVDEVQEAEIIKILEQEQRKLLKEDPMRELEEALMDRTTASQNRR